MFRVLVPAGRQQFLEQRRYLRQLDLGAHDAVHALHQRKAARAATSGALALRLFQLPVVWPLAGEDGPCHQCESIHVALVAVVALAGCGLKFGYRHFAGPVVPAAIESDHRPSAVLQLRVFGVRGIPTRKPAGRGTGARQRKRQGALRLSSSIPSQRKEKAVT